MLPRTAVLASGHAETLTRNFSSSAKRWAGIAIGGGHAPIAEPSSPPSSSTPRPSFAKLRGEVQETKHESPSGTASSSEGKTTPPTLGLGSTLFAPRGEATPHNAYTGALEEGTHESNALRFRSEDKAQQQNLPEQVPNRRNPFSRRPVTVTDKSGGEGLGLRMKMASDPGPIVQSNDSSSEYQNERFSAAIREGTRENVVGIKPDPRQGNRHARPLPDPWQPLTPGFEGAQRASCTLPGYEDWTVLSTPSGNDKSKHLFARRIEGTVESNTLTCFIALNAVLLGLRATPRRMTFGDLATSSETSKHFFQIEIGGREGGEEGKRPAGLFTAYPDLSEEEARMLQQINPVLKTFSDLQQMRPRSRRDGVDATGSPSGAGGERQSYADRYAVERDARIGGLQQSQNESRGRTRAGRNDGALFDETARSDKRRSPDRRGGQWRPQEESQLKQKRDLRSTRQATATREKYVAPQRNSKEKQFEDLVATYQLPSARGLGILDRLADSKRKRDSPHAPIGSSLGAKARSAEVELGGKSGEGSNSRVEDATPVAIDGQQAEGTAASTADVESIASTDESEQGRKAKDSEGGRTGKAAPSMADPVPIEEATPIPALDDMAGGSALSPNETSGASSAGSAGSVSEIKSTLENKTEPIESATPVKIDGEQPSGTAATEGSESAASLAEKLQPRENGNNISPTSKEKDASIEERTPVGIADKTEAGFDAPDKDSATKREDAVEEAVKESPLGRNARGEPKDRPVDDSTPVHVDGDQAEGTTNTTGSQDAAESARKREEGQ